MATLEEQVSGLVGAANNLTETVSSKMAGIDQRMDEAEQEFESFRSQADGRYALQSRITRNLRVDGDQNFWYPVLFNQPNGAEFFIRRYVHSDSGTYGNWNGTLEFLFKANDAEYGGNVPFIIVDRYLVGGKASARVLPDADIPFIGKLEAGAGPYGIAIYLRGNTSYHFGCDVADFAPEVVYETLATPAGYPDLSPIPVSDGVHASVPAVGFIRGD